MGAKEGALILDLIARLKDEGNVSIIMILHNYVHVFQACDRVSLIQDGLISLDKPTSETSVDELNEIVVEEYRRARLSGQGGNGGSPGNGAGTGGGTGTAPDASP
jgi:ABC-type sugar transport system ATPase subunit